MGNMSINSDDLKYGIECCIKYMACVPAEECCDVCPYHGRCGSLEKDALALIQQLEAQVPKWNDAKSNPPKKSGKYLVWIKCEKGTWAEEGGYDAEEAEWSHDNYHDGFAEVSTDFVTHWMPLPEPPKEE